MANKLYLAVIHQDGNNFGASFPDFPGCVAAGDTLEDVMKDAKEALEFHLEGLLEDGATIPEPSDLSDIQKHEFAKDGVVVPIVIRQPGKTVRINLTVRDTELAEIDELARQHKMNRSEFMVSQALR